MRTKTSECSARLTALHELGTKQNLCSKPNSPTNLKKKKMSAVHLQEGEIPHSQNPMQKKLFAAHSRRSPVAGLSINNENN